MDVLEQFLIELYYHKSVVSSLDMERCNHYVRLADSNIRNLPVSVRGLIEHVKRACFQAGWLWQEAVSNSSVQNPADWGWELKDWGWELKEGRYVPTWKVGDGLTDVYTSIQVCSNCKKALCKRCKCKLGDLKYLPFCGCQRKCPNK